MKKTNNPFKMIGSYLGIVGIYLLTIAIGLTYNNFGGGVGVANSTNIFAKFTQIYMDFISVFFSILGFGNNNIGAILFGFLIGWGLTLLIRKIRGK